MIEIGDNLSIVLALALSAATLVVIVWRSTR